MEGIIFLAAIVILIMAAIAIGRISSLSTKLDQYNSVFISKLNLLDEAIRKLETKPVSTQQKSEPPKDTSTDKPPAPAVQETVIKDYVPVQLDKPVLTSQQLPKHEVAAAAKPAAYDIKPEEPKAPAEPKPQKEVYAPDTYAKIANDIPTPVSKANGLIESFFSSVHELGWEQWLGTRGVLLAGIITTLIGGGFFAKYASEIGWLGPVGRALMIAGAGLLAIIIGEFTRRKDFGIVARGLTALGFGLLYSSTFASYQIYEIIGSKTAFTFSILITIAAMSYSVTLDEKISAFVALLGGYLSPAMLSTGHNSYNELFSYLTVLSAGAMICANYRKWRAVNWLAFIGTAICYCGWANKYNAWDIIWGSQDLKLLAAGSIWAGVFFIIFLVLPVLHELRTGTLTKREDVSLILANGIYSLFVFAAILHDFRQLFALVVMAMSAAHLGLMAVVHFKNQKDTPVQAVLFSLSVFFATVSLPIFFDAYALTIAWAAEGVILAIIAHQYKSKIAEFGSIAVFILTVSVMYFKADHRPEHLKLALNSHYISLTCSALCFLVGQYLYRRFKEKVWIDQKTLVNLYYFIGTTAILLLSVDEWYWHCKGLITIVNNRPDYMAIGTVVMILIYAIAACLKPIRPDNNKWLYISSISCAIAASYALLTADRFYDSSFRIFLNMPYAIMIIAAIMIFAVSYISNKQNKDQQDRQHYSVTAFIAIGFIWIITTMQIRSFWEWYPASESINSRFMTTMYISVFWAIYAAILIVIGFWKKIPAVRYASLGLFALTLGKVFIYDMSNLANIYRIAGFVVLGVLMVSVSFAYQYSRKKSLTSPISLDSANEDMPEKVEDKVD